MGLIEAKVFSESAAQRAPSINPRSSIFRVAARLCQ